jgi:HAD superfamily hydrolase (TIGR01509 family)
VGLREAGLAIATASASRNADRLLATVRVEGGSLRDLLDADVSGLDVPGKPDPALFLEAARRLGQPPQACLVVEDAPAGVEAARRAGMASVGVDRNGDAEELRERGADVVLDRLDAVPVSELLAQLADSP